MTNHFKDISYYRNLDPLILYGDTWLYGAALPNANIGVPTDVYVLHEKNYNIISWKNSVENGIIGYYVYRSTTIGHGDAKTIAVILERDSIGEPHTCYVDYLLNEEVGQQYYYAVASISTGDFVSFRSNWAADINLDNSFTSTKYLYTNQLTQSYWTIIDLYKQLGNIDTDRNIVPFRDLGNTYVQTVTDVGYPEMFLKNELSIDEGHLNNNSTIEPGYLGSESNRFSLLAKNIPVKVNCNYLYLTTLPIDDIKTYTFYMDNIPIVSNISAITSTAVIYEDDSNANLSLLEVDKVTFESKVSEPGTYSFYWNSVYNRWQTETDSVNLNDFGISYKGTPQPYNKISVDYNKVGYVYFRIPYIYNSKVLQTYIKSDDGIIYNEFAFKTYNHLIFASTLGKIFNDLQLKLKESKGNLYTSDVSDPYVYKNFASYFNFEQPAWLSNANYRNCVLGDSYTGEAGLWQAAIVGGTQLGLKEAVEALASGNVTISSLTDVDYVTCYNSYKELEGSGLNLTEILPYESGTTYVVDDIVFYNNNYYKINSSVQISNTDIFSSLSNSDLECVNNEFKDALFIKNYNSEDQLTINTLTDTEQVTYNKYDLVNINSHFYEVREQFNYFYVIIKFSNVHPTTFGLPNGTFYYNTLEKTLYKIDNGVWVDASSDLKLDALYFNEESGDLYNYNGTDLVNQTFLRSVDKICYILKFNMPSNFYAIYKLIGTEYYLVDLLLSLEEKDYIFWENYTEDSETDPISYTQSYIINTYKIEFDNWKRVIAAEKYLVYGNKIKLNNENIIYPSNYFIVYTDESQTDEIPVAAYSVDSKTGTLNWQDLQFKPDDGSYVYITYVVDIRSDIKKLIELFKFPQVNIEYSWVEKED